MEVPRGFTRCDECGGFGIDRPEGCICSQFTDTGGFRIADLTCPAHGVNGSKPGDALWNLCPSCSGSGLVPTEKLREEASSVVWDAWWGDKREPWNLALMKRPYEVLDVYRDLADAVLAKVAEHLGGRE